MGIWNTLNTVFVLACVTGVVGCGRVEIDPTFAPYVESFTQSMHDHGITEQVTTSVEFGDLEMTADKEIGQCNTSDLGGSQIIIDRTAWSQRDEAHRKVLMYHELGHCVLHRKHNVAMRAGYPASIMNPSPDSVATGFNYDAAPYEDELFAR